MSSLFIVLEEKRPIILDESLSSTYTEYSQELCDLIHDFCAYRSNFCYEVTSEVNPRISTYVPGVNLNLLKKYHPGKRLPFNNENINHDGNITIWCALWDDYEFKNQKYETKVLLWTYYIYKLLHGKGFNGLT